MTNDNEIVPSALWRFVKATAKVIRSLVGFALLIFLMDFVMGFWGTSAFSHYRVERLIAEANVLSANGDTHSAILRFSDAIRIDPQSAEAYFGRAQLYRKQNDFGRAKLDFIKSASHSSNSVIFAERLLSAGLLDAEEGRFEESLKLINDAIEIAPSLANAYAARARIYYERNQYQLAIADLDQAISLNSQVSDFYVDRARIHQKLGNVDRVRKDTAKAFALDRQSPQANAFMALLDIERNNLPDAIPKLTLAIEQMPGEASFYELRAHVYRELGAHSSAEKDYEQAESIRKEKTGS